MNETQIRSMLQGDSVPTIPAFALKIVQMCENADDVSLTDLAALIQQDAATSAKLLRLANSPLYGAGRDISSIQQAASILGLSKVRMVAISSAMVGNVDQGLAARIDLSGFWRGTLITSLAARELARRTGQSEEEAFIAGLLMNLGIPVMVNALGDRFVDVYNNCSNAPLELHDQEMDALGTSHAEVGSQLLETWSLPNSLVNAVFDHEDVTVEAGKPTLALILRVADAFAAAMACADSSQVEELRRRCALVNLADDESLALLSDLQIQAAAVANDMDIDIGQGEQIDASRVTATCQFVDLTIERGKEEGQSPSLGAVRVEIQNANDLREEFGSPGFEKAREAVAELMRSTLDETALFLPWRDTGWLAVMPSTNHDRYSEVAQSLAGQLTQLSVRLSGAQALVQASVSSDWVGDVTALDQGFRVLLERIEETVAPAPSAV